ncbi:MAG: hypothetical protein NZ571_04855, partial [Anaerolineae bacterium]|nr:hypothetical protein [Anaerolineae bacterium]
MHVWTALSKVLDKPSGRALWIVLSCLPILTAFFIVLVHGANHPFLEEWYATALIAIAVHDGTFTLSQLFEPVNEHPYVVTKAILALHTALTNYDLRVDMLLNVVMSILIALGVIWLVRRQDRRLAFQLMFPLSVLLISHLQAVNWLIAFQNIFLISALCIVIVLLLIQLRPISWQTLCLAAVVALIGSFSMGVAPLMWLTPLIALWLRGYRRWWHYALWFLCAALVFAYFAVRVTESLNAPLTLEEIGLIVHFALAFLGRPLLPSLDLTLSTVLGIVGIALFAFNALLLWLRHPEWLGTWASLAAFSVGAALLTGYGRRAFFVDYALYPLEPRYITHSLLFWSASLVISASNLVVWRQVRGSQRKTWRALRMVNLSAGVVLSLMFVASLRIAVIPGFKEDVACMLEFPMTRDLECAIRLGSEPKHALPALV